jgi:hypothetical protein
MKYYFKSPEELREKIEKGKIKSVSPFRNRTFLIIFADILIFSAVIYFLHFTGLLYSVKNTESKVYKYYDMEISAVVPAPKSDKESDMLHYLRVKNTGSSATLFPEPGTLYECSTSKFRVMSENSTVYEHDVYLERRLIEPGKTEIFRSSPAAPELKSYSRKKLNYEYIIECKDKTLHIPL